MLLLSIIGQRWRPAIFGSYESSRGARPDGALSGSENGQTMNRLIAAASVPDVVLLCGTLFAQQSKPQYLNKPSRRQACPAPKTQAEFNDYKAAYAISGGAASEKAADDFAAKYPASELKSTLFAKAMHEYQTENNAAKIFPPDKKSCRSIPTMRSRWCLPPTVLADSLSESDSDRDKKARK